MTVLQSSSSPVSSEDSAGALVLRSATAADLGALTALENASFANDRLTRRRLRALIAAPSARLIVADRGGAILGYALVLLRRGSGVARLYSIAVAAGAAGRGTGRRLVAAAEAAAVAAGARILRLEVRADNPRAVALYRSMGYAAIGERPRYYADGVTALRYEKPLTGTGA